MTPSRALTLRRVVTYSPRGVNTTLLLECGHEKLCRGASRSEPPHRTHCEECHSLDLAPTGVKA